MQSSILTIAQERYSNEIFGIIFRVPILDEMKKGIHNEARYMLSKLNLIYRVLAASCPEDRCI